MKLTAKKEAFCLAYIETNNASEAYRRAYDASKMKDGTVHQTASRLLADVDVTARLEQLRAPVRDRAQITLESHLERLNHLSLMAEQAEQYSAAIKAEESRGKVAGLYVEKIEHSGTQTIKVTADMNPQDAAKAYQDLMNG